MTGSIPQPSAAPTSFEFEMTDQGEQSLMPGVTPITMRQRLEALAQGPLIATKQQKPLNIGLFDEDARNQLALF